MLVDLNSKKYAVGVDVDGRVCVSNEDGTGMIELTQEKSALLYVAHIRDTLLIVTGDRIDYPASLHTVSVLNGDLKLVNTIRPDGIGKVYNVIVHGDKFVVICDIYKLKAVLIYDADMNQTHKESFRAISDFLLIDAFTLPHLNRLYFCGAVNDLRISSRAVVGYLDFKNGDRKILISSDHTCLKEIPLMMTVRSGSWVLEMEVVKLRASAHPLIEYVRYDIDLNVLNQSKANVHP